VGGPQWLEKFERGKERSFWSKDPGFDALGGFQTFSQERLSGDNLGEWEEFRLCSAKFLKQLD